MNIETNHMTAAEADQEALTKRAKAILKKTDGLGILKPNTVGYTIALSAVEEALREVTKSKK